MQVAAAVRLGEPEPDSLAGMLGRPPSARSVGGSKHQGGAPAPCLIAGIRLNARAVLELQGIGYASVQMEEQEIAAAIGWMMVASGVLAVMCPASSRAMDTEPLLPGWFLGA
jgi:hypothetical protein